MTTDTSGPAFPGQPRDTFASNLPTGMSLRDWFAGQALPTIYATSDTYTGAAREAYEMADAMLAERNKP